jgi:hypothetical protein
VTDTVIVYRSRPYLSTRSTNVVPQSQAWTPASVSTLFWFDADDAGTITGDPCTQWNDKSGNGRHLTVPSGSGFDVTAAVQNGKTGLWSDNDGVHTFMATVSTFTQAQPLTVYMAIKRDGAAADAFAILWDGEITASGTRAIMFTRRSDVADDPTMFAGSLVSMGADLAADTPYYLTAVFDGASSVGYRNGVSGGTVNPGAGGITGGIYFGIADAYFLEMFAVANAGTDRASAEAYLAAKWGI